MRRRFAAIALIAMAAGVAGGPQAGAQVDGAGGNNTVTATVLGGTRSVAVTAPVGLTGAFAPTELTGSYTVTVAEAVRSGTNPWSVQAAMTDLTRQGGTETIPKADITLTARDVLVGTVVKVGLGDDPAKDTSLSDAPTTANAFSADQVLFRIIDENPNTAYTNTYVGSGSLAADVSTTLAGTYVGTITYTLVQ